MNQKVVNILWLLTDKVVKLGTTVYIFSLLAKNYTIAEFGEFNLALSIIAVFSAFSTFGLNGILVNEYIRNDGKSEETVTSALFIRIILGLFSYVSYTILVLFLISKNYENASIFIILGLKIIFSFTDSIRAWFESKVQMKYIIFSESLVMIISSLLKIILVVYDFKLVNIAYVFVFESLSISVISIYLYFIVKKNNFKFPKKETVFSLIKKGAPLIVASIAWIIYTRIDQMMIGVMISSEGVAYYAAASRLSDIFSVVPVIFITTIVPGILKLSKNDFKKEDEAFGKLYTIIYFISICLFVFIYFLSPWMIEILYGADYQRSTEILKVHAFSIVLVAFANISGRYFISRGLQKITMKRHLYGILINFGLNLSFIPIYGELGAAYATLISLILVNYIYDIFQSETRICFYLKTKAITFQNLISSITYFKKLFFTTK